MKFTKIAGALLGGLLALALVCPLTQADPFHQSSMLKFDQPIQIPGNKVLPSGTYWFSLLQPELDENLVAIYNANRTRVEALLPTNPTSRLAPSGRTEIVVVKQSPQSPDLLLKWFYPGTDYGHEFIYSRARERQLNLEARVVEFPRTGYVG